MNTLTAITETNPCFLCCFCKSGLVDDINLGQLFMYEGVVTHYFCMLFSAALSQHGSDNEGILGFLPQDIMAEVRRSWRLRCTYCNTAGASVGCCNKKCRTAFHFPCGLKNGANFQFFGNYESYCSEHVIYPKIVLSKKEWVCPICTSPVINRPEAIQSSCCKSAVFHKECLQKLALSSGYFFKCPMCNNGKEFVHEMRSLGIFVPEQDASWEREPNAFEDLYYQHSQCDVADCLCPKGPSYSAQKGSWIMARCRICGASGTHKQCSNLTTVENWACEACLVVELRTEKDKETRQVLYANTEKAKKSKPKTKDSSSDEQYQEAYVSARSGNRKVRNGRLQKRLGKKSWKMSDIVVSPWCFWFFPYDKVRLEQFDAQTTLPDWRQLYLRVNLVNWIPKSLFEGRIDESDTEDQIPTKVSLPKQVFKDFDDEDRALISDSEIVSKAIPVIKRKSLKIRRRRRPLKTSWGKGVIKKSGSKKAQRSQLIFLKESDAQAIVDNVTPYSVIDERRNDSKTFSPHSRWEITNPEQVLSVPIPNFSENFQEMSVPSFENLTEKIPAESNQLVWTSEDFQIDIQSSIEISSDDNLEPEDSPLEKNLGTEAQDNQMDCSAETELPKLHDSVFTEGNEEINVNHPGDENATQNQTKISSELVETESSEKDKKEVESMLPLTELNSDISHNASPTKLSLQNPSHNDEIRSDENQEDILLKAKHLHATQWMDHPYCKPTSENVTSMNSSVSDMQPAHLF